MGSVIITVVIGASVLVVMAFIPRMLKGLVGVKNDLQIQQAEHRLKLAEIKKAEAESEKAAQEALNETLKGV